MPVYSDEGNGADAVSCRSSELAEELMDSIDRGMAVHPASFRTRDICMIGADTFSIAADVVSDYCDDVSSVPVHVVHGSTLPGWVGEGTLAVLMSLDGGCSETLDAIGELGRRGCRILALTSGGPLEKACVAAGGEMIRIPSGMSLLNSTGFAVGCLLRIVVSVGVCDFDRDMLARRLSLVGDGLEDAVRKVSDDVSGCVVASYSPSEVRACSIWWRSVMASSTGDPAFHGELPEFDHNELVGWSDPNEHAPELRMAVLRGESDSLMVNDIIRCMLEVLSENGRAVEVVDIGGSGTLAMNLVGFVAGCRLAEIMEGSQ